MPRYDFRTPRIYVDGPLKAGLEVPFHRDQANHLVNVLRLTAGDGVLLFNGRDGEWLAALTGTGKRSLSAKVGELARPQPEATDLHFMFAPLKHARLDYMVQKAVELGVSRLRPIMTQHTQVTRINTERMRANAIEAAQQCGVLAVPEVSEPVTFKSIAGGSDPDRLYVFCDEEADVADPVEALVALRAPPSALLPAEMSMPIAVLIGPEGGFSADERAALLERPNIVRLSLGPLILRADTAAVSALTLVQAVLGNWR